MSINPILYTTAVNPLSIEVQPSAKRNTAKIAAVALIIFGAITASYASPIIGAGMILSGLVLLASSFFGKKTHLTAATILPMPLPEKPAVNNSITPEEPVTALKLTRNDNIPSIQNTPTKVKPVEKKNDSPVLQESVCPISLVPFRDPCILLEDGFTYEKSYIEQWLSSNPNRSPMIGVIPSATLAPNYTLNKMNTICPITQETFREPYYCLEDGHTYEKDAILKWFEGTIKESLKRGVICPIVVRSPVTGINLTTLTLYPNKILFNGGIPSEQKPDLFRFDLKKFISDNTISESKEIKCVFDEKIRRLINRYANERDSRKEEFIKTQIHSRRKHLGLNVEKTEFDNLDLSHLNLSGMHLKNLGLKSATFKETDLSDTTLENCSLSRCRFLNCNMQRTVLISCDFRGEEVSFFGTDMTGAIITNDCYLEKGSTWRRIRNWGDFVEELSTRGALNVDSVTLRTLQESVQGPTTSNSC